ncbi:MAG: hypothetical protein ACKOKF_08000, partial [Bacteroidota bacterium]
MKHLTVLFTALCLSLALKGQLPLQPGRWHADIALNDSTDLSFILLVTKEGLAIENADETVLLEPIRVEGEVVSARFALYDAELKLTVLGPIVIGEYINHGKTSNNVFN